MSSKQFKPHPSNGFGVAKKPIFGCPLLSAEFDVDQLRSALAEDSENRDGVPVEGFSCSHEFIYFSSAVSWASLAMFLFTIFAFAAPITVVSALLLAYRRQDISIFFDPGVLTTSFCAWLILLFSWLSLKCGWLSGKLSAKLSRQKGTVTIYKIHGKGGSDKSFDEFDGFINGVASPNSGHVSYDCWLSHKQEKLWFACNLSSTKTGALLYWDFILQYMDLSQPLPDVPELEPFRQFDEATVKWDKDNKRPASLYRDMSLDKYKRLVKRVWEYVEKFPDGKTREEAIAAGWQPPPEQIWKLLD